MYRLCFSNDPGQKPPSVSAGHDTVVVVNQPLQLQAVSNDSARDFFLWTPVTGLDNPNSPNPIAVLSSGIDSIRYLVRATDVQGCYGETSIGVKVYKTAPDIFVPNAFTPDKNINNVFRPIAVGISSIQYFRVYNRWGQLIYNNSGKRGAVGTAPFRAGRRARDPMYGWFREQLIQEK